MKNKVFGYITRKDGNEKQILVYTNRHFPDAGMQIPGGTVEPGEKEEEALYREIEEESGLVHLRFVGKLGRTTYRKPLRREDWHFFHVESRESPNHRWVHRVTSFGKDDGHVFEFFWVSIAEAKKHLTQGLGDFLHLLEDPEPGNPFSSTAAELQSRSAE